MITPSKFQAVLVDLARRSSSPEGSRGQALVELGISSIFLLLLVMGIIDFGYLYGDKVAIENASRAGARYASTHPTSWSNSASPDLSTIEGQTLQAGGVSTIPNADTNLTISYYDTSGSSPLYCGKYVASSNTFSAASGYTQASCVVDGNLVQVHLDYWYPVMTPLISSYFSPTIHVSGLAAFAVQQ